MSTVHVTDERLSDAAWPVAKALGAKVTALCGRTLDAAPVAESARDCPDCALLVKAYDLEVRR